jgi:hypothetical protein
MTRSPSKRNKLDETRGNPSNVNATFWFCVMVLFVNALLVKRREQAGIAHHSETNARTRVYLNIRATQIADVINNRGDRGDE